MTKSFIINRANNPLFLRNNYRRLVWGALALLIINSCVVVYIIYLQANLPQPDNFATTSNGEIIKLHGMQ